MYQPYDEVRKKSCQLIFAAIGLLRAKFFIGWMTSDFMRQLVWAVALFQKQLSADHAGLVQAIICSK